MNRRQWMTTVLIAFFVGAAGSILLGRFFIPYLASATGWQSLNKLVTNSPIIINRTNEIQLNEGVNMIDLAKQASSLTVTIFSREANPRYLGNGMVMTSDGMIFSSKSILGTNQDVTVILNNGNKYQGQVRAVDPKSDLAVITISERNLNIASLANAADLSVGQRVLIPGESYSSLNRSFATGYVTNTVVNSTVNLGRTFSTEVLEDSFEIDAVINNGRFIGSPVVNLNGRVVGMVSNSSIQKIIVAENLQTALSSYLSSGKIVRPQLGVTYIHMSKSLASLRNIDRAGFMVVKVDAGSPASGKFLANDYIYEVDGQNMENQSLEQVINRHPLSEVRFKVIRDGKEIDVAVNLEQTK
ncbi:MAG: S1C family serine protease [Candidatus Doudnabacteria bacterium]|nr:S1C family serine protease [Candidatus Doudnabacteria bacterium]